MPRILPLETPEYSSEIRIAFTQHKTVYNTRITNMKATLGHSATAFKVYMQWYPLFQEVKTTLGPRLTTLFALAVSEAADCTLCIAYFRKEIIESGENPDALSITESDQQLLSYGAAIVENRGFLSDGLFDPIRKRYTDEEIVLFTAFAGIMVATNLFNNVINTEIDKYLEPFQKQHI